MKIVILILAFTLTFQLKVSGNTNISHAIAMHGEPKYSKDFLDLRKKYFQISRVLKDSIKNDEIKLCNDRIDIVKSVINSLVKKQKFNKDELYLECCSKISVFELDIDLFEKSLDYLISRDYIKNEDSIYQALFY